MLEGLEKYNGLISGRGFNTITNNILDQKEYRGEHSRTQATRKLRECESSKKPNYVFHLKSNKKK